MAGSGKLEKPVPDPRASEFSCGIVLSNSVGSACDCVSCVSRGPITLEGFCTHIVGLTTSCLSDASCGAHASRGLNSLLNSLRIAIFFS